MHGDLLSPRTFGHGGASGCVLQVDPDNNVARDVAPMRRPETPLESGANRIMARFRVFP